MEFQSQELLQSSTAIMPETEMLITEERAKATKEIEEQVVQLAEVQHHLSKLVYEEGEKLSIAEENILSVVEKSHDATESLSKAENYQNARYWRNGLIGAVVVGIGAGALALTTLFSRRTLQ